MVDGLAVLREEVLEFVRSKVCLVGNARYATAHGSAQENKCFAKWRTVLSSSPEDTALEHRKIDNVAGFSVELERVCTTVKSHRDKISSWSNWCEEVIVDGNRPVVETLAQNWTPLAREVQHEFADSHQRTSALLSWTCGQNGLLRDLCKSLEMCITSVVEMAPALLERGREGQVGRTTSRTFKIYRWKGAASAEVSKVCGNADGFAESAPQSTGLLQFAQDRGQWRQFVRTGKI